MERERLRELISRLRHGPRAFTLEEAKELEEVMRRLIESRPDDPSARLLHAVAEVLLAAKLAESMLRRGGDRRC